MELISGANKAHDGLLVPLIKMVKGWNRIAANPFRSFYLELMIEEVLRGVTISDFPSGVRFVLDKGKDRVRNKIEDPAGYGDFINPLEEVSTVEAAVAKFTTACDVARKAERLTSDGQIESAIREWQRLFGDYFPAYG